MLPRIESIGALPGVLAAAGRRAVPLEPSIVAIGGGTGLAALLRGLRECGCVRSVRCASLYAR